MECYPVSQQPPREGVVCLPFDAAAPMARAAFALSDARQLTAPEGLAFLDQNRLGPAPDWLTPAWRRAMEEGLVRVLPIPDLQLVQQVQMVLWRTKVVTPQIQGFLEELRQALEELPG